MAHFRLAVLVSLAALACSGTDEGDVADSASNAATSGSAGSGAISGGVPSSGAAPSSAAPSDPGLPGVNAPTDVAAPPADAEQTPSGLASKRLFAGTGTRSPRATDRVRVHYSGWQTNGMRFDSSVVRGTPAEFALNMVISGWTEGLQLMVEGEERRLWIPESLAYRGAPDRPSGMLVFDVQLIAILTQ